MNWKAYARTDGYGPKVPYFEKAQIFLEHLEQEMSKPYKEVVEEEKVADETEEVTEIRTEEIAEDKKK